MTLSRLFAYAVEPQRPIDPAVRSDPSGGQIQFTTELENALDAALQVARRVRMTEVALRVDRTTRTSEVRNAVMRIGFEARHANAEPHALKLAQRLAGAMDNRSPACLFLAACYREAASDEREVALWIFPRDEAFRFRSQQHVIDLLNDIFSRTSTQRKLALFRGQDLRNHFLKADVLDFQAAGAGEVARFWIDGFLDAELSITPQEGTRVLAEALKAASTAALSHEEREQLHVATLAASTAPQRRWSLENFAEQYLEGLARERFIAAVPNDATRRSLFNIDRDALQRFVPARIFRLEGDVIVSAPLEQVGQVVQVEQDEAVGAPAEDQSPGNARGERLRVEGLVIDDRLGRRRA